MNFIPENPIPEGGIEVERLTVVKYMTADGEMVCATSFTSPSDDPITLANKMVLVGFAQLELQPSCGCDE